MNLSLREHHSMLEDSDIVHTFTPILFDIPHTPLVSHFHHEDRIRDYSEALYLPFSRRLWNLTYRHSDSIIAVSNHSRCELLKRGHDPGKITVVPNGVDTSRFAPGRRSRELEERFKGKRIVLYVGPMVERKGLRYLIEAMPNILKKNEGVVLVLVGGQESNQLRNLAQSLGISRNVMFEGIVSEDLLPSYYNACDVFVLPSLQEGFGMVLIEAMACGKAVVASDTTAIPEVVGDAGVLVRPRDSQELEVAISRLLEDDETRRNLESKGLRRARERFSWDKSINDLLGVYEGLR